MQMLQSASKSKNAPHAIIMFGVKYSPCETSLKPSVEILHDLYFLGGLEALKRRGDWDHWDHGVIKHLKLITENTSEELNKWKPPICKIIWLLNVFESLTSITLTPNGPIFRQPMYWSDVYLMKLETWAEVEAQFSRKDFLIFSRHTASFQRRWSRAAGRLTDWQAAFCFFPPGGNMSLSQIRSADIPSALPFFSLAVCELSLQYIWGLRRRVAGTAEPRKTWRAPSQMAPPNASENIMLCWGSVKLNLSEENSCAELGAVVLM